MRISDWSSDVCSSDLHHVGRIFGAAVDFGLPLLPAEALDLGHGHAGDAEPGQRLAHLVELERFDDSQDQLHDRSEEHTSELQSLMRISYAVICLKKKKIHRAATK